MITQYYNIIQGNLKSSQVFIRATEFNSDVRKVQKAKLLIPDEQILLNDQFHNVEKFVRYMKRYIRVFQKLRKQKKKKQIGYWNKLVCIWIMRILTMKI